MQIYIEAGRKFWLSLFATAKDQSLKGEPCTHFVES